jgi:hypothetical protein
VREIRDTSIAAPDQAPMTTLGRRQTIAVPLEVDSNGRGAALGLSVKYRFDVVSLGIEDEGGIVAPVITAFARRTFVLAARRQGGMMERLHHHSALGLERKVMAARQAALGSLAVGGGHEKLIRPEYPSPAPPIGISNAFITAV